MKIQSKQIHEISEELQSGGKVFINRETYEIKSIVDPDDPYFEPELWGEDLEIIENEWVDYVVVEKMESRDAYRIMENFVDEIEDKQLKCDLIKVLNRKRPFANFKAIVETSQYRQNWFDFRDKTYEKFVIDQLKSMDIEIE